MNHVNMTRRWFQRFFIFTPILGEMMKFDSYFSNGLKPPTRWLCEDIFQMHPHKYIYCIICIRINIIRYLTLYLRCRWHKISTTSYSWHWNYDGCFVPAAASGEWVPSFYKQDCTKLLVCLQEHPEKKGGESFPNTGSQYNFGELEKMDEYPSVVLRFPQKKKLSDITVFFFQGFLRHRIQIHRDRWKLCSLNVLFFAINLEHRYKKWWALEMYLSNTGSHYFFTRRNS